MRKTIICFVLAAMQMIMPTSALTATAENIETVASEPLESMEYSALHTMGFIDEDNIARDDTFTRAQFVGALFRISGYTAADCKSHSIPFVDVSVDTPYKDEICGMHELGFVNGTENGRFSPDDAVTYEQAVSMAVSVLGYREYSIMKYGNTGVRLIRIGAELKLNRGVETSYGADAPLSAESAVRLLYNAARCCVMEQSSYSTSGNVQYEIKTGAELISRIGKIYFGNGIVESDGMTSITNASASENVAAIGGKEYRLSGFDVGDLLGCRADFFYRDENEIRTLLWAAEDKNNSCGIVVGAYDLMADDREYSRRNIVYSDGDVRRELKLDEYADIIWNGSRVYNRPLMPTSGTVRFVDHDDDGEYEVVIVREFENMFVRNISLNGNFIVGKYDKQLRLDEYEDVRIVENGRIIDVEDIPSMRVVSYIKSGDGKHLFVLVNSKGFTARADSIGNRDAERILRFGDREYKFSSSFEALAASGKYDMAEISVGEEYKVYLDADGRIAHIEKTSETLKYALVIKAGRNDEKFAASNSAVFRLLLESGEKVTAATADKMVLDGTLQNNYNWFADTRLFATPTSSVTEQVVKVAFDAEGKIKELDIAFDGTAAEYGYTPTEFSLDCVKSGGVSYSKDKQIYLMNYKYHLYEDSLIFAKMVGVGYDEPYFVVTRDEITGQSKCSLYDCDKTLTPGATFVEMTNTDGVASRIVLVEDVTETLNSDGEVLTAINGLSYGKEYIGVELSEGVIGDSIARGDIVRVSEIDRERKIVGVKKIISVSNPSEKRIMVDDMSTTRREIFSPLYSVGANGIVVFSPEESGSTWNGKLSSIPYGKYGTGGEYEYIQVYDTRSDKIYIEAKSKLVQSCVPDLSGATASPDECSVWVYVYYHDKNARDLVVVYY